MSKKRIILLCVLILIGVISYGIYTVYGANLLSEYYFDKAEKSENASESIENYMKSLEFDNKNEEAITKISEIYIYNEMYEEALDTLIFGVENDVDNANFHLKIIKLYEKKGEISKIISYVQKISSETVASKIKLNELKNPKVNHDSGRYEEAIKIEVTSDNPVYYRINGDDFEKYQTSFQLKDGFYTIDFVSIDSEGRITEIETKEYEIEVLASPVMFSSENITEILQNQLQTSDKLATSDLNTTKSIDLSYEVLFDDDIQTLVNCKELETLKLGDISSVTSLKTLAKLKNLTEISVSKGANYEKFEEILQIPNIQNVKILNSPLQSLPQNSSGITQLTLKNCFINDISKIDSYKTLEILDLESNELTNVERISELKILRELSLSDNQLTKLVGLSDIISLKELNVSKNKLDDISEISKLLFLEKIDISYNEITSVGALSGMRYLEVLNCSNNLITTLEQLTQNESLKEIHASNNSITDISYMGEFTVVNYININENAIENY